MAECWATHLSTNTIGVKQIESTSRLSRCTLPSINLNFYQSCLLLETIASVSSGSIPLSSSRKSDGTVEVSRVKIEKPGLSREIFRQWYFFQRRPVRQVQQSFFSGSGFKQFFNLCFGKKTVFTGFQTLNGNISYSDTMQFFYFKSF